MSQMKAVRFHEYGPPSVLRYEDVPIPVLESGDVLVRVHAAGVNPVDAKIRAGLFKKVQFALPLIPGWDLSGVVDSLGDGSEGFAVGDAVYSKPDGARNGCYAEFVAVKASELAPKPSSLDHVHAAGVPLAALTAWQGLFDHGGLEAGQTVLIHAAAGGVGSMAVQLARWCGATVIATASADSAELVKRMGASVVVNYKSQRFEDFAKNVDLVFDTMGGETYDRSWETLSPDGIMVSLTEIGAKTDGEKRGMRGINFMCQPNSAQLREIGELIDAGRVKPIIAKVLPLSDALRAHEMIETHHTHGKIVLKVV